MRFLFAKWPPRARLLLSVVACNTSSFECQAILIVTGSVAQRENERSRALNNLDDTNACVRTTGGTGDIKMICMEIHVRTTGCSICPGIQVGGQRKASPKQLLQPSSLVEIVHHREQTLKASSLAGFQRACMLILLTRCSCQLGQSRIKRCQVRLLLLLIYGLVCLG